MYKKEEKINNYIKNIYIIEKQYGNFDDLLKAIRLLRRIPSVNHSMTVRQTSVIQSAPIEKELYKQVEQKLKEALSSIGTNVGGSRTYLSSKSDKSQLIMPQDNIFVGDQGVYYKFNRGVVVINDNGTRKEEILDGTYNHHVDATVRQAASLNILVPLIMRV